MLPDGDEWTEPTLPTEDVDLESADDTTTENDLLLATDYPNNANESEEAPIEIVAQKATGSDHGYSFAEFTVKNVSGSTIHRLTLDIKILDENKTVLSTTHPQDGVLLSDGEIIVIEALTEEGAYAMQLDGYSYVVGSDQDGEYVRGYFSNTKPVVLREDAEEGDTEQLPSATENGCFVYTARSFMERFDAADNDIDGYNYMYARANDESLYYELIEGTTYESIRTVGMVAFDDIDGNPLSKEDDFTECVINTVTILIEDEDDFPIILIDSMRAADTSLDFTTARNIGNDVVNCAGTEEGYTYNGINYVIVADGEYYYIIISVDEAEDEKTAQGSESSETIEVTDYSLNFANFSIPIWYENTDTDENIMWFEHSENANNRIMVEVEEIPNFMKIDTGDGEAITTATDTVNHYIYDMEDETISKGWETSGDMVYYEKYFSTETSSGIKHGRSIVVPIEENEQVVVIHALFEDEDALPDIDTILESIRF